MSAALVGRPAKVECFWHGSRGRPEVFEGFLYVDPERKRIGFSRFVEREGGEWYWELPISEVSDVIRAGEPLACAVSLTAGVKGSPFEEKKALMVLFLEREKSRIGVFEPGEEYAFKFSVSEVRDLLASYL